MPHSICHWKNSVSRRDLLSDWESVLLSLSNWNVLCYGCECTNSMRSRQDLRCGNRYLHRLPGSIGLLHP